MFPFPLQPKGLNPFEGFLSVDHSACMVPWWFPPPTQPKGLNPLEGFISVDHSACMVPWWFPPPPNLKGWIPLKGLSVLIIPPVWYPDGSPPTQPKGLNPLEGFLSVDHSACMVPWWFPSPSNPKGWIPLKGFSGLIIPLHGTLMVPPPTQPKGLNSLEGFLSVDHSACMVLYQCWSFRLYGTLMVPPPPNLKGWIPLRGLSVLIIPPVWYPDVPPHPT